MTEIKPDINSKPSNASQIYQTYNKKRKKNQTTKYLQRFEGEAKS